MTSTDSLKWGVFSAQYLNLSTWDISMLVNELASYPVSLAAVRQLFRQPMCRFYLSMEDHLSSRARYLLWRSVSQPSSLDK